MKKFIYALISCSLLFTMPLIHAQDPLSDCEIYMDELELQLKKDQKDTKKYFHIQLEEGNAIFEKDLRSIASNADRRELKKQYKSFVRDLEKDYNKEMDKLESVFYETLEGLEDECGSRAVRRRLMALYVKGGPNSRSRP